jgi:hypothetical protein
MVKFINILGIIIGLIMLIVSAAKLAPIYIAGIGLALVLGSYFSDRKRAKKKKNRIDAENNSRIDQLTAIPWKEDQTLYIYRPLWSFLLFIGIMGLSLWGIYFQLSSNSIDWLILSLALFFFAFTSFGLILYLSNLGKPALVLSKAGISYFPFDFIPWANVKYIYSGQLSLYGQKRTHLHIKFKTHTEKKRWKDHLLVYRKESLLRKGAVDLSIDAFTERPEVIFGVAEFLFKDSVKLKGTV